MNRFLSKLFGKDRSSWEEIPDNWRFSDYHKTALKALRAYGIEMRGSDDGADGKRMTFLLPMEMKPEEYVEIGYLVSQLARKDFPEHYSRFGFATDAWGGVSDPTIRFLDMCPGGYRIRVMTDFGSSEDAEQDVDPNA